MATGTAATGERHAPDEAEEVPSSWRPYVFLDLAIVGLLGQLALFGVFLADKGLDPAEFGDQIFSSTIAALAFADLMTCAVVFLAWLPREAARVGIRRWWPFVLATLGGLCFAFPLFLYFRERRRVEGLASARPAEAF
jgi:hypothetical protein